MAGTQCTRGSSSINWVSPNPCGTLQVAQDAHCAHSLVFERFPEVVVTVTVQQTQLYLSSTRSSAAHGWSSHNCEAIRFFDKSNKIQVQQRSEVVLHFQRHEDKQSTTHSTMGNEPIQATSMDIHYGERCRARLRTDVCGLVIVYFHAPAALVVCGGSGLRDPLLKNAQAVLMLQVDPDVLATQERLTVAWTLLPCMLTPRVQASAAVIPDGSGRLLLTGGFDWMLNDLKTAEIRMDSSLVSMRFFRKRFNTYCHCHPQGIANPQRWPPAGL